MKWKQRGPLITVCSEQTSVFVERSRGTSQVRRSYYQNILVCVAFITTVRHDPDGVVSGEPVTQPLKGNTHRQDSHVTVGSWDWSILVTVHRSLGVCCGLHHPSECSAVKKNVWGINTVGCKSMFEKDCVTLRSINTGSGVCWCKTLSPLCLDLSVPSGSVGSSPLEDADPAVSIWQLQTAPAGEQLCLHHHPTGWSVCHQDTVSCHILSTIITPFYSISSDKLLVLVSLKKVLITRNFPLFAPAV